jgi:hypothetical protein
LPPPLIRLSKFHDVFLARGRKNQAPNAHVIEFFHFRHAGSAAGGDLFIEAFRRPATWSSGVVLTACTTSPSASRSILDDDVSNQKLRRMATLATLCAQGPSVATDLLGTPSAHLRITRQRSDKDRGPRDTMAANLSLQICPFIRSSEPKIKGTIGRPVALVITSLPTAKKARFYNETNFSFR